MSEKGRNHEKRTYPEVSTSKPPEMLLMMTSLASSSAAFVGAPAPRIHQQQQRARAIVAQVPETDTDIETKLIVVPVPAASREGLWSQLEGGLKYVDEKVGTGEIPRALNVVSLHYTVSFSESGQELGSSRKGPFGNPLTFALGKHDVPVFSEGIKGMRIGGKRRLVVPAAKIPPSQVRNVPKDQEGEPLTFEIELLEIHSGVRAIVPNLLPPGNRRLTIARFVFALSFIPYFFPEDIKPNSYKMYNGMTQEEVQAKYAARSNSAYLGTQVDVNNLFPPEEPLPR